MVPEAVRLAAFKPRSGPVFPCTLPLSVGKCSLLASRLDYCCSWTVGLPWMQVLLFFYILMFEVIESSQLIFTAREPQRDEVRGKVTQEVGSRTGVEPSLC